jgi:hypothetical protein
VTPSPAAGRPDDLVAEARALLAGTGGWWASVLLDVATAPDAVPAGTRRLLLRRPLMAVPAGVRAETADEALLAAGLGDDLPPALHALLDPLSLVTGLPWAAGTLPGADRRSAAAALEVTGAVAVDEAGRAALRCDVVGAPSCVRSLVLDRDSGLPLVAVDDGGTEVWRVAVAALDPRVEDEVFRPEQP